MTTGRPVLVDPKELERLARSAPRGLARFVDGRFSLDRLIAATRSEPEAMREISAERVARIRADREAERRRVDDARASHCSGHEPDHGTPARRGSGLGRAEP